MTEVYKRKMAPSIVNMDYKDVPEHFVAKNWQNKVKWKFETKPNAVKQARDSDGFITDQHTGIKYLSAKGLEGDHIVPKYEVFLSGGEALSNAEKKLFSHDLRNISIVSKKTNRTKGTSDIAGWVGAKKQKEYAESTETIKNRYGLSMDKKEASVFKTLTGRKTTTKIAPSLDKTPYCTRCHIKHSVGSH
tara:strand:+ start:232 stop:801 length:570 start_codon:yes stop_codon:yes gene_type:complete